MAHALFNLLPNICGILLATLGVALVFTPEVARITAPVRLCLALFLLVMGALGLYSSYVQSRDESNEKLGLSTKIDDLQAKSSALEKTVSSYGPKLDALVERPGKNANYSIQRDLAIALRNQLRPRMEVEEPRMISSNPNYIFNSEVSNIGGSIAKGVVGTVNTAIRTRSRESEDALFEGLYKMSVSSSKKPHDIVPGLEGKFNLPIYGEIPISRQEYSSMQPDQVLYLVTLISFRDETGTIYHTEKCMFVRPGIVDTFCDGHNNYH